MSLPVIILGGGGHSRVLIDILSEQVLIKGITVADPTTQDAPIKENPIIGGDQEILRYSCREIVLVNGIGIAESTLKRKQIFETYKAAGYSFIQVIHRSVIVSSDVRLAEGVQLMAGSIIQPGSQIGLNTLINTQASVDHDCLVGAHVHIAPGATLCGGVTVGNGALIGAGATILQGIRIGTNSLVGAGSVVTKDVPDGVKVIGVPARVMREWLNGEKF